MKKVLLSTAAVMFLATPAWAASDFKAGDFMIRARAVGVLPDENGRASNGDTVSINDTVVPEVDFTYFFTPNIAAELIAATTKHNVKTSSGIDAGSAWLLPPTLTVQYHFTQLDGVKPYIGAGINYTHFYNEKGGALSDVSYDDSFGPALQAGVDVPIATNWYLNADVKKIWINTDATFSPSGVTAGVDIDPWVAGVGVGYKF